MREAGIEPAFCIDHGMTFSYYYADPDGNHVELQMDVFGDWAKSTAWMKTSEEFKANPDLTVTEPDRAAFQEATQSVVEKWRTGEIGPFVEEVLSAVNGG